MSDTNEPSPRPWRVADYAQCPGLADIFDASGSPSGLVAGELKPADAALIVDAVNERDSLRDQLAAALRLADECSRDAAAVHAGRASAVEEAQSEANRRADRLADIVRRMADVTHSLLGNYEYRFRDDSNSMEWVKNVRELIREARAAIGEYAP